MASKRIYSGATSLPNRRVTVYTGRHLIAQFELDRSGIAKIAVSEPLQHAVRAAVVERAMPYAVSISPRGDTLDYVSSWRAADGYTVIAGMRRAACKLVNISDHAAAVEWGRGGKQGILRRTLAHLNSTSPIGLQQAARKARAKETFNPDLHPRGPRGRFAPTSRGADQIRRRASRAARITGN